MKKFFGWIKLKIKLNCNDHKPPYISEGDIWWVSLGENVGSEICGKSGLFSRPVVVLRKLAHGFYFVIPTTTKPKVGSWYVSFSYKNKVSVASLHQARAIDYRRLSNKIGTLSQEDFTRIKLGFKKLYIN